MKTHYSIFQTFKQLRDKLNLTDLETSRLFHLSDEDLKSLELGLLPLNAKKFKKRVLALNELVDLFYKKNRMDNIVQAFRKQNFNLEGETPIGFLCQSPDLKSFNQVRQVFDEL